MKYETTLRKTLVAILQDEQQPISVQDFLRKLTAKNIHRNKTSVYRQLDSLIDENLVTKIVLSDGIARFEMKSSDEFDYAHFVCKKCDIVSCAPIHPELKLKLANIFTNKSDLSAVSIEIDGVCDNCKI